MNSTWTRPAITVMALAGVVGAVAALALLVAPPSVPEATYSYPLATGLFDAGQEVLFLHHVAVGIGMLAVARTGGLGRSRLGVAAASVTTAALFLLGVMELLAISVAAVSGATDTTEMIDAGFAIASLASGVGLLLLGVAAIRARAAARWLLLVMGIYVFVPLTPFSFGPMALRAPALAVWSLLFTALGVRTLQHMRASSARAVADASIGA